MPYTPTTFVNNQSPPLSAAQMNKLGSQHAQALADIIAQAAVPGSDLYNALLAHFGTIDLVNSKADQSTLDTGFAPIGVVNDLSDYADDPFGFGFIPTYTYFTSNFASPQTWAAANDGRYVQTLVADTISKIGFWVEVASGNMSVGVNRKNGTGRAAVPGTQASTSGPIAMSSLGGLGYREITLPSPIRVEKGDYLALSCDNATASFAGQNGASKANVGPMSFGANDHYPLPALASTNGSLFATTGRSPYLVGIR